MQWNEYLETPITPAGQASAGTAGKAALMARVVAFMRSRKVTPYPVSHRREC